MSEQGIQSIHQNKTLHSSVGIKKPYKPPGGSTQHLGEVLACLYSSPSSVSSLLLACWHHAASDPCLSTA